MNAFTRNNCSWLNEQFSLSQKNKSMKRKHYFIAALVSLNLNASFAQNHPTNGLIEYFSFDSTLTGSEGTVLVPGIDNINNYANYALEGTHEAYHISDLNNRLKSDTSIVDYPLGDSPFTVCYWLKIASGGTASLFNYYGFEFSNVVSGVYMTYDAEQLSFGKVDGNQDYTGNGYAYPYNTASNWHHIALVHSPGSTVLYVDGVSIGSDPSFVFSTQQFTNSRLKMGWSPGGGDYGNFFLDDFLIYNRSLTTTELSDLIGSTASLSELEKNALTSYPNPATDEVTIDFTSESPSNFSIIGTDSREMAHGTLIPGKNYLDLRTLATGTYFLKTTINGTTITQKISKL